MSSFHYSKITFINAKLVKDYILNYRNSYSEDSFIKVEVSGTGAKEKRIDSYCMRYEKRERLLDLSEPIHIPLGYFDLLPFLYQGNIGEKKQKNNRRARKEMLDGKGLSYYDGLVMDALATLAYVHNPVPKEFRPVKFNLSQLIKTISCSSETQLTDAKIEGLAESLNRLTRSVAEIRNNGKAVLNHYLLHIDFAKDQDAKRHKALLENCKRTPKDDANALEDLKKEKLKELRGAWFVLCSMPVLFRYAGQMLNNQLITVPSQVMNNVCVTHTERSKSTKGSFSVTTGEFDLCVKKYLIMRIEQKQRNAKHYKEITLENMLLAIKGREFITATPQQKHQWAKAAVKTMGKLLAWYKGQGYIKSYKGSCSGDHVRLEETYQIYPVTAGERKQFMNKDPESIIHGSANAELTRALKLAGELEGRLDYLLNCEEVKLVPEQEDIAILSGLSKKALKLEKLLSAAASKTDHDDEADGSHNGAALSAKAEDK